MLTLYQFSTSPFSEKVRRALAFKQVPYLTHEVDRAKARAGGYAEISPTGKFPAILDGGIAVWDSTDVLVHLDRAHPDRPLIPVDPREAGLAHAIEEWADESLYFYEMAVRLTWEHNLDPALDEFMATMPGLPREQVRANILNSVTTLLHAQGTGRKPHAQIMSDLERHFTALDGLLAGDREWLVGDALSVADIAVRSQVSALLYAVEAREALARTSNIAGWIARIDKAAPAGLGDMIA